MADIIALLSRMTPHSGGQSRLLYAQPLCWDPRAPLILESCVISELKEAERVVRSVFATPQDGEIRDSIPKSAVPPNGYFDALGELVDPALLPHSASAQRSFGPKLASWRGGASVMGIASSQAFMAKLHMRQKSSLVKCAVRYYCTWYHS